MTGAGRQPRQTADQTWLTIREVAERLAVSRDTVERWIHAGYVQAIDVSVRNGSRRQRASWRVASESLERFLKSRSNHPSPPARPRRRHHLSGVVEFIK